MPSLSFHRGITASCTVALGKTIIVVTSKSMLEIKAVHIGTGLMTFRKVSNRGVPSWQCDISMPDSTAAQAEVRAREDGSQEIEVELQNIFPAGLVLDGGLIGALTAPAVHINVPWLRDVWVFLVRSPWFPLRFQTDRPMLSLERNGSKATVLLGLPSDGSLTAQVALEGTGFKNASLVVRRTIGSHSADELVGEIEGSTRMFAWKPTVRAFDLLLVTGSVVGIDAIEEVARSLGAQTSRSMIGMGGGWKVDNQFVLCDGPATSYAVVLRGHRGLLENPEDQTGAKFT